ncbi:MAG TPA: DUF502 domain-containing protein [Gemmatimonadaceae bacterium]|nr:DUF502 domain-containing protein [Gemmatimonadaceae bacterium]
MPRLLAYFLRGLVVLTPIAITAYVVWLVLHRIDGWLGIPIPGVGLLVTLVLITVVGFLASTVITRSFVKLIEDLLAKLPFVRLLYSSSKDLLNAFVGEHRRFDRPALVTVGPNVQIMGFVTQQALREIPKADGLVAVYCPQSYHWAGQLLIVPASQVTVLSASAADVLAFIVSGGVTGRPFGMEQQVASHA